MPAPIVCRMTEADKDEVRFESIGTLGPRVTVTMDRAEWSDQERPEFVVVVKQ